MIIYSKVIRMCQCSFLLLCRFCTSFQYVMLSIIYKTFSYSIILRFHTFLITFSLLNNSFLGTNAHLQWKQLDLNINDTYFNI